MSNYSKTTNFLAKDSLISGDPLKVIKGSEHDTEYTNIATAIASKADASGTAITSGAINGTTIGASTPSTGAFTTVSATGLITASAGETIASGQTLTLTGATVAGAPTWSSTQTLNTSGNAATVTTNANLTGPITSTGNATAIASGNTYASPTLTGTVSGTPTWASNQAITLSTAAQPNVTSLGASVVWGTGVANFGTITKRKTADESVTSSTTLQDDDHLTFAIAANEEWVGIVEVSAGASLNTTGIKVTLNAPSGATGEFDAIAFTYTQGVGTGLNRSTSFGTAIDFTTAQISAGNARFKLAFWILNGSTPGSVTFQFAQSTNSGTAVTARKGSFMQATRVA